ncbi:MAG: phosphatidylglycerol lysyltransferase [Spirochaetaceae bacterium]|jgi:phosphoglucomutase|nr:phosphatidylglycerol lysyltransferase [Spirochaetaceae bacterium]
MEKEDGKRRKLEETLAGMILSPSGWRGVFARDGGGESKCAEIAPEHTLIARAGAKVFADSLRRSGDPVIILGMDTRPTGPAIAEAMIRAFIAEGCKVQFAGVTAAPEIMAYARSAGVAGTADGFAYISASHNPIGHNGLKFGRVDGGVLSAEAASGLIADFRDLIADSARIARLEALCAQADTRRIAEAYAESPGVKKDAYAAYLAFTREVVFGLEGTAEMEEIKLFRALREGLQAKPLGVAVDFNGSARTLSIDREFFERLGVSVYAINDTPGGIAHRIVPEGESLEPCRRFLEAVRRDHPETVLGYTPDCDGDRGNLVIWDEAAGKARSLEAQEVFALACVSELAHLVWTGELDPAKAHKKNSGEEKEEKEGKENLEADGKNADGKNADWEKPDRKNPGLKEENLETDRKNAVAVNDPTSMRVDRIAGAFGVSVFRAEVGEANVVGLARELRGRGYTVRILGEGSAGGNITHPSAVRDPINTVMALVKLLTLRGGPGAEGFFAIWRRLSGQAEGYRLDFTLSDILDSLPKFVTTGSYTSEAALQVKTRDHALLKDRYQAIFLRSWEARKEELRVRYGITGWSGACYNGMTERRNISRFRDAGKGGLKVTFSDSEGNEKAWIWMRGSATEPVFRVMADAEGSDTALERDLIEWQRRMVIEADQLDSAR